MPMTKIQSKKFTKGNNSINRIELWILYAALLNNVTYLCMKFEVISLNTFQVMPQTRFHDAWTDGQGDSSITPPPPFRLWGYKNLLKTLCEKVKIHCIGN